MSILYTLSLTRAQSCTEQSSGAVGKSRWPSWAPVPRELCESRGGRPGLPSIRSCVKVEVAVLGSRP